jgi:protein gp37
VFCASLADWLDNQVPQQWRLDLAQTIDKTPQLDWLLLTKRIENFDRLAPWPRNQVPENIWIGATCENQEHFDRRWPHLSRIDARVRFVSYEPALGPLTFGNARPDWVICGGENGTGGRMMDPQWARDLRAECAARGTAFFLKQMTGKAPIPADLSVRQFPAHASRAAVTPSGAVSSPARGYEITFDRLARAAARSACASTKQ